MNSITTIVGSKENIGEDVRLFSEKLVKSPEVLYAGKKEIKSLVIEKASALFIENNLVLVLVDPEKDLLEELKGHLSVLSEKINIIIYLTSAPPDTRSLFGDTTIIAEKEKEKRVRERVLSVLKGHDKVMTDKGFKRFREKIKDESMLESELMKLINYVGERREIKSADVDAIVTETHEESLLTFFDVIAQTDKKELLKIFENLLLNGLNILAIQGFLVKQTRLMLQAKDMEDVFGANPEYSSFSKIFTKWKEHIELKPLDKKLYLPHQKTFYAYKLSKTSQRFKRKDLLFFLDMLLAFDAKVKSGTKHDRIYLEQGLLEA